MVKHIAEKLRSDPDLAPQVLDRLAEATAAAHAQGPSRHLEEQVHEELLNMALEADLLGHSIGSSATPAAEHDAPICPPHPAHEIDDNIMYRWADALLRTVDAIVRVSKEPYTHLGPGCVSLVESTERVEKESESMYEHEAVFERCLRWVSWDIVLIEHGIDGRPASKTYIGRWTRLDEQSRLLYTHPGIGGCNRVDLSDKVNDGSITFVVSNTTTKMTRARGAMRPEMPQHVLRLRDIHELLCGKSLEYDALTASCAHCGKGLHSEWRVALDEDYFFSCCPVCCLWWHEDCLVALSKALGGDDNMQAKIEAAIDHCDAAGTYPVADCAQAMREYTPFEGIRPGVRCVLCDWTSRCL